MVQVIDRTLGTKLELIVITLFAIGVSAFILTSCAFGIILHEGSITHFPPSDARAAYMPGPNRRGTIGLVWSCVSTIFSCVYVSVHVDVPNPKRNEDFRKDIESHPASHKVSPSFRDLFFRIWSWTAYPPCRRVIWMLFNIYAPELVVFVAMLEYMSATSGRRFMKEYTGRDGWTMTHAFFADMGGFEVEEDGGRRVLETGREFYIWFVDNSAPDLDFRDIRAEIDDRSKASLLLKALTCFQVVWVVVETIARGVEHRPISALEIATCAYIFCNIFIYSFWWSKPYDIRRRVVLKLPSRPRSSYEMSQASGRTTPRKDEHRYRLEDAQTSPSCKQGPGLACRLSRGDALAKVPEIPYQAYRLTPFNRGFYGGQPCKDWLRASYFFGVMGLLVGLIHCTLWNTQFVNTAGQWMWRISCIMQIALPVIVAAVTKVEEWYSEFSLFIFMLVMAFLYCVSRTLLFVLIVLSFWSLPAGVYSDVTWSIPHWS